MNLPKKKNVVVFSVICLATIGISFSAYSLFSGNANTVVTGYTKLSKTELVNSVSTSGNVESSSISSIFSSGDAAVKKIHVSVGDHVAVGDVLAELDTEALLLDIAQQRSLLNHSQKLYKNGADSELIQTEYELKSALADLNEKKADYESNKILFKGGAVAQNALDESESAYKLAADTYQKNLVLLDSIKDTLEKDIESQLIDLQKIERELENCTVKSPAEGTVTAVYAKEGAPGNGLLFIVEDTRDLIVAAFIKEYDVAKVHEGQLVTIKSDSIGDVAVAGKVIAVDPASKKDVNGMTEASSAVEYQTKIGVLDQETKLKIGMNVRLNIILEKRPDVFAVPSDAVVVNSEGKETVLMIVDDNGNGTVKEIEVTKGMETDLYTEISGEGITEGIFIINDGASVKPGSAVNIETATP